MDSPALRRVSSENETMSRQTLIIDAGHGGEDGGAVSLSGVKESDINLEISKKLELIAVFYGVRVVMTRTTQDLDYSASATTIRAKKAEDQKRRLALINKTQNAVLISIHQNTYPSGSPNGAQVLYAPTGGSKPFADVMQSSLIQALDPKNRRTASKIPDSILLMNNIKCPALLIECGFLTNAAEEQLLLTAGYQIKIAATVAACYLTSRDSLYQTNYGGTNEG
ncbi:N-acetylmuramoyl-L-alanine amidase [Oscillospiraceae bacterium WX1]